MSNDPARRRPQSPNDSVEALARRAVADGNAREKLLREIRPLACRWALVRTGDEDLAEDVAQEVLLRVHRYIRAFDGRSRFTTWLYRVVASVATDAARRRQRDDARSARLASATHRDPASVRNPADAPDAPTIRRMLSTFLSSLSPRQRAAFELVDLQGYSGREAAEMEQIDEATLRVHLSRARSVIRAAIHERAM